MAFGGDRSGNVLDRLLERLGVDPEDLEDLEDPSGRIGSGPRRVPLSGLGDKWFVPVVSLVRKGQVPKAKVIALKSAEEGSMAAVSNERFLAAIIRAALDRPEGDDLAVLEARLESLEPTPGAAPKAPAVATKSLQGARPDRDHLGRRVTKPHGLQSAGGL